MSIEQLISPIVPTLLPTDTGDRALRLMEQSGLTALPLIADEGRYTALVQEADVLDWPTPEAPLTAADFLNYRPAVSSTGHPYEALRIAQQANLSVVPVLDNVSHYLGAVTRDDLLRYLAENSAVERPGGIIILEVDPHDYSLTQIARIVESEDVTILSSSLCTVPETGLMEVTLKTNRTALQGVVQAFERYEYTVKHVYGDASDDEDVLSRYNLLMTYINM